jgi:hypothetical protein
MEPISIFNLVLLFIFIDISKINHLWNENLHRRALHHQQGIFFNPNKKPWIKFLKTKMNNESIDYINDIKIDKNDSIQTLSPLLSKIFGGNYSKKATLYFNDFDEETQKNLEDIGKAIKPQLEELCGEKLELGNSNFRCVLLRYEGADSEFIPHYDTEPHNCYRTLFLIKKEGNVPPFIHYDEYGNPHKKYLDVGEGLFFKGTRTFHGVGNTGDETMKRYMIGWQYNSTFYNTIGLVVWVLQFYWRRFYQKSKTIYSLFFFNFIGHCLIFSSKCQSGYRNRFAIWIKNINILTSSLFYYNCSTILRHSVLQLFIDDRDVFASIYAR